MRRIYWNLFGKIWIQNVGDIDFKVIFATENSNKFQKTKCVCVVFKPLDVIFKNLEIG